MNHSGQSGHHLIHCRFLRAGNWLKHTCPEKQYKSRHKLRENWLEPLVEEMHPLVCPRVLSMLLKASCIIREKLNYLVNFDTMSILLHSFFILVIETGLTKYSLSKAYTTFATRSYEMGNS